MNCEAFGKSLYSYLGGRLDAAGRTAFEAHRAECGACAELYEVGTELTCRELTARLDDYIEDRMSPERLAVFERHLSVCRDCVAYLESYRRTMKLTREALDAPDARVPGDLPEDLVRAILAARRRRG